MTSDDLIASGGMSALTSAIAGSDLIVMGDATAEEVAMETVPVLAQTGGISGTLSTGAPLYEGGTQLAASGDSTGPGAAAPSAGATEVSRSFHLSRAHDVEVWALVRTGPTAGEIDLRLDHRPSDSLLPLSMTDGAFEWVRVDQAELAAGPHTVSVRASDSAYGGNYDVEDVRVVDAPAREAATATLDAALASRAADIAYAIDAADVQKGDAEAPPLSTVVGGATGPSFWSPGDPGGVLISPGTAQIPSSVTVTLAPGRRSSTILAHSFTTPQNWSDAGYVEVAFDGTGRGEQLELSVAQAATGKTATFTITDDRTGPREIALSTAAVPGQAPAIDWSQVGGIRLSSPDRQLSASLVVGDPELSAAWAPFPVSVPVAPVASPRAVTVAASTGQSCPAAASASSIGSEATTLSVTATPVEVQDDCRLVVLPADGIHQYPAGAVSAVRNGSDGYTVTTDSAHPGVIVLDQGYEGAWRSSVDGGAFHPAIPTYSLLDGFAVPAGAHRSTIDFGGDWSAVVGAGLSAGSGLLLAGLALAWWARRRPGPTPAVAQERDGRIGAPVGSRRRVAIGYVAGGILIGVLTLGIGLPLGVLPSLLLAPLSLWLFWYGVLPWWVPWGLGSAILLATAALTGLGISIDMNGPALLVLVLFVNAAVRAAVADRGPTDGLHRARGT